MLQKLDALLGKRVASLVICRGRRRIGKSTLIEHFVANNSARFIKKELQRDVIEEMEAKVSAIRRREGVSVFVALVHFGEVSPVVAADGYFSAIIPFRKLLGL